MNEFDQFIKHHLQLKFYIRYTDDFVIVDNDQTKFNMLIFEINNFIQSKIKLGLHPKKVNICPQNRGVDFLGYVVLPHYRALRTKTKKRMLKKINQKNLSSYLGLLKHCKSKKLISQIAIILDKI